MHFSMFLSIQKWLWCSVWQLQVNGKSVKKQEEKTAAAEAGDEKSTAKSGSTAKPTPGNSNSPAFVLLTSHHK